jgi:hypothetical protein
MCASIKMATTAQVQRHGLAERIEIRVGDATQLELARPAPTVVLLFFGPHAGAALSERLRAALGGRAHSRVVCMDYRMAELGPAAGVRSIGGVEVAPGVVSERHHIWRYEPPYRTPTDAE